MAQPSKTIVVVDDDPKVLQAFTRLFEGRYAVTTYEEPESALKYLKDHPGVAVVVSCMNLPGRGGFGFLLASQSLAPMAARILLTADKSLDTLKRAVNEVGVFMFISKPCSQTDLVAGIEAGVGHHARLHNDRMTLEKTIGGSVKLLIDMLSLFHAEAFRRTHVIRPQAVTMARKLGLKRTWELEMAVMFSPLGEALLPKEILSRYRSAKTLTDQQRAILATAPRQTRDLLNNIPQLEKVAEAIYCSGRGFDGSGFPEDGPSGRDIPLNARILKLLTDLWYASPENGVDAAAFEALQINHRQYDPELLEVARQVLLKEQKKEEGDDKVTLCHIRALRPGDVLVDDVLTDGTHELVLSRGHELTGTTIRRLDHYNHVAGIRQPIRVHRQPAAQKQAEPLSA
ncbi:HD domain-containing phosphohydrolase [Roseibium limicola]|uniref:Response regulator n=1 Tax=Roseibium limicola TaxID=2816037 RepID=A0A939EPW0_9HYPH|nr:HD domain-containing phosphohydrolase [Roseibium limicola]MBO0345766.1 response regulator [Roseibium limicola]